MRLKHALIGTVLLLLAACATTPGSPIGTGEGQATGTIPSDVPTDTPEGYPPPEPVVLEEQAYPLPTIPTLDNYPAPIPDEPYPAPESGLSDACEIRPPDPVRLEFTAEDGTALVGTYYPPGDCGAPLALLFHQNGRSKEIWVDLALWMQNRNGTASLNLGRALASPNRQYEWFPPLPASLSVAVLAIDFRNHGESGGSGGFDPGGYLMDARAALALGRNLPEVDSERILTLGSSIGADAAVDVCISLEGSAVAETQEDQGCRGALSLSPGNFLAVDYARAVRALGEAPHQAQVRCLAAQGDGSAPDLCQTDFGDYFQATIYPGSDHGIDLIEPGRDPDIAMVILEFLQAGLGLR